VGYVAENVPSPAYINQHIALVRFGSAEIDAKFASYFLASETTQRLFWALTDSGAKAGMSLVTVRKIKIAVPPTKAEQEAIAKALSDADALIESLEQLTAKKRNLKRGTVQQLVSGKKRLRPFGSDPRLKRSEVGIIPNDWEEHRIGTLCEIAAGGDLARQDFSPTLSSRHRFPVYSNAHSRDGLYGFSQAYQYDADKITITARGDVGKAVYRTSKFSAIGRLLVLSKKVPSDLRFVAEYINNFVDFALESTGVPQLTAPQLSKYRVAVPPTTAEQTAIGEILADIDDEIAALDVKLAKARQVKQGMMQNLLTGKVRLI
jgi:type I restriction enzyme S subunit